MKKLLKKGGSSLLKFGLVLTMVLPLSVSAEDEKEQDHPLLPKPQNSRIGSYDVKDFDVAHVPTKPFKEADSPEGLIELEGEVWRIEYLLSEKTSLRHAQVSYQAALKKKGFTSILQCRPASTCGSGFLEVLRGKVIPSDFPRIYREGDPQEWVEVFKGTFQNKEAYVLLVGVDNGEDSIYQQIVIPSKPELIVSYGTSNQSLALYIVGRNDGSGPLSHNRKLSEQRAATVRSYLCDEFDIDPTRVEAYGAGPLAPVASNRAESGRAANRRMMIVEKT